MENQVPTFTISEFGRRARKTVRTLRFYEELGLLSPTQQNSSGHRLYGLAELAKLQQIQSLKFIGYSLQEIKSLIEDDLEDFTQLEASLSWQHKLLTKKRDELNRALEAIERVQFLKREGKPITWTILSALLYQMEHEQDQIEWAKEYFSDDFANQFFTLSKDQRLQMDIEMLDVLATVKKLVKDGASPQSPEAFNVLVKLTDIVTKHVEDKEEFAEQMKRAMEEMESDVIDFQFPNFFTSEETAFIEAIGKSMEALYRENEER
ncbi:MerR family transcriptional regulator [Bacillus sp. Bva_UNVM-123]|uniref:MerR family transcriptional regulator n=1 Tax=Bacillus sp. Bva_UNVM-123 TaxID=2829798 RepID=UPI00391F4F97